MTDISTSKVSILEPKTKLEKYVEERYQYLLQGIKEHEKMSGIRQTIDEARVDAMPDGDDKKQVLEREKFWWSERDKSFVQQREYAERERDVYLNTDHANFKERMRTVYADVGTTDVLAMTPCDNEHSITHSFVKLDANWQILYTSGRIRERYYHEFGVIVHFKNEEDFPVAHSDSINVVYEGNPFSWGLRY